MCAERLVLESPIEDLVDDWERALDLEMSISP
jgi:hypothetical protein